MNVTELKKKIDDVVLKMGRVQAAIERKEQEAEEVLTWMSDQEDAFMEGLEVVIANTERNIQRQQADIEKRTQELSEFFDTVLEAVK